MAHFGYNHHDIYYNEFGFGEPLLLLHGNTASSVMFDEIAAEYAKDRRVIVMDFLGCGKSDRVESLADDLWYDEAAQAVTLLDEKGYTAVDVIGTSGGAQAAINIALERPNLVNRLIADSFEHGGHPAMLTNQDEFLTLSREFFDAK